jgi:hypothetical protein
MAEHALAQRVACCDRPEQLTRKEKFMSTVGKIVASAAIILTTAFAITMSAAFANAPGGAYIQCDGSQSSPVRCTPDNW